MWWFGPAVPGVYGGEPGLVVREPAEHVGLEQETEPVSPVSTDHGGVVLVADPRALAVDHDDGVPGQLAGVAVPRDDPVESLALGELGLLVAADPLG